MSGGKKVSKAPKVRREPALVRFGQWFCLSLGIYVLPIGMCATVLMAYAAAACGLWLLTAAALGYDASDSGLRRIANSHAGVFLGAPGAEAVDGVSIAMALGYVVAVVAYAWHVVTDQRWKGPGWRRNFVLRGSWMFRRGMRGYFPHHVYVDGGDGPGRFQRIDVADENAPGNDAIAAALKAFPTTTATADGEPARYLFCCHPHGLFSMGVWCTFGALNEGIRRVFHERGFVTTIHTMSANFIVSLWREMILSFPFSNSDRSTLHKALTPGAAAARAEHVSGTTGARRKLPRIPSYGGRPQQHEACPRVSVLVPGGAEESLRCTEDKLTLRKRKGFVRVALETGASLVPVYTFGESRLYAPVTRDKQLLSRLVRLQKRLGVGTPLVIGDAWWNAVVPKRGELHTVIGKPIDVRRFWRKAECDDGEDGYTFTDSDVDALHAEYIAALQTLYRTYQPVVAPNAPAMFEIVS